MSELERVRNYATRIGTYYVVFLICTVTLIMVKTREYIRFNELSELGVIRKSAFYFNLVNIVSGTLLFTYFSRHFGHHSIVPSNVVLHLGRISALGQIGLGAFPNLTQFHVIHVFFVFLFFGMATILILIYSSKYLNKDYRGLIHLGYFIGVYSAIYPLYLRNLRITKGIWQIIFSLLLILWFTFESKTTVKIHAHNSNLQI